MAVRGSVGGIDRPEKLAEALRAAYYLADDGFATAGYLALALGKPLLLEGAPGVGKTEAAKAVAQILGRDLVQIDGLRVEVDRHQHAAALALRPGTIRSGHGWRDTSRQGLRC